MVVTAVSSSVVAKAKSATPNTRARATAEAWRLTATNVITQLADIPVAGNSLSLSLPLQSITLLVVPPGGHGTLTLHRRRERGRG